LISKTPLIANDSSTAPSGDRRADAFVVLLAPKAGLIVRSDLHPAIQHVLLDAASQIHSGAGVFRAARQFPAPEAVDLPLSTHARQYHKSGRRGITPTQICD
jgi:hypothetical protein